MKKSSLLRLAATAAALALLASGCAAKPGAGPAEQPSTEAAEFSPLARTELIAPAAPGSGWDQTARAVQAAMQAEGIASSIEVSNVPGASGTVALAQVAPKAGTKDLLIASGLAMMSGIITNASPVSLDDLTPIARLIGEYEAIVVPAGSPYANVDELFAAIKKDPKSVAIAGGSAGSADHLFIGLLAEHYGVKASDVNYVAYSGGGEATTALLGNKVQAGIAGLSEFSAQIDGGKLTGLLISSVGNESGTEFVQDASEIDPELEFTNWRAVMAPSGLDAELTAQYLTAFEKMHASDAWAEQLTKNSWVDTYLAGDEFGAWLKTENERVTSVLDGLGLSPQ